MVKISRKIFWPKNMVNLKFKKLIEDKKLSKWYHPYQIDVYSKNWQHLLMLNAARRIRDENGYDNLMWSGCFEDLTRRQQGILLFDKTGNKFNKYTILGYISFVYREYLDYPPVYAMQWVYIEPWARRSGILEQWLPELEKLYPGFLIEKPYSQSMKNFIMKHNLSHRFG